MMKKLLSIPTFSVLLLAQLVCAQIESNPAQGYTRFSDHTVYHSVFNSTMVKPDVANLHRITRGKDRMLVNVALVTNGSTDGGLSARVSGSATNLMQQKKELAFKAIVEGDVTYYLAPLRITNEEIMHFALEVTPEGAAEPYTVKFSKKLYVDQ
ncbi:MAG: DUF4426 domain-containing protein [Cellvibrionaceae bacterium]